MNALVKFRNVYSIFSRFQLSAFPIVPKSTARFVTFLFLLSFLLTVPMPIVRFIEGHWIGTSLLVWLTQIITGVKQPDGAYLQYSNTASLDIGFALHALFGLIWLSIGWFQIAVITPKFPRHHRWFGLISVTAFALHVAASLALLFIIDTQQHAWLVKAMLASNLILSTNLVYKAIKHVRKGNRQRHADYLVRAYLYSIEGAGAIRTVGYMLWLFDQGPTYCQELTGSAAACVVPYVWQLIFVRLTTLYWLGCYVRMRSDEVFSYFYRREVILTCCVLLIAAILAPVF